MTTGDRTGDKREAPANHLFQTEAWVEIRRGDGWQGEHVDGPWGSYPVLLRPLPIAGRTVVEAPYGPPGPYDDPAAVRDLLERLVVWARRARAAVVRINPYLLIRPGEARIPLLVQLFAEHGFRRSTESMGYVHTYIVDLTQDEGALWAGFESPARRAVKKSERSGVTVADGLDLEPFTRIYEAMARRTGLVPESRDFFDRLEAVAVRGGELHFLEAQASDPAALGLPSSDTLLAGLLFSTVGSVAVNLWGASAPEGDPVRANVRLQWEAIRWARRAGLRTYDLGGFTLGADEGSKKAGIQRYKKQYGGELVELPGTFSLILDPWVARAASGLRRLKARLGAFSRFASPRRPPTRPETLG